MLPIPQEVVAEARKIDLLTYLKNYEPYELVEVCKGTYTTKTHDSLKISNGLWYWFTRQVGGKSAIDYLMKVKNYNFVEAVKTVMGNIQIQPPTIYKQRGKNQNKNLILPLKAENNERAINLYKKFGFKKLCTLEGYMKINGELTDCDLMMLKL